MFCLSTRNVASSVGCCFPCSFCIQLLCVCNHNPAVIQLDRPQNNFDIAGVPTGHWESGLFSCLSNVIPSCVLSFFCPCVMWAQIVVRSQIPCLISFKNSFRCLQNRSGYSFFMELYFLAAVLLIVFIILYSNEISYSIDHGRIVILPQGLYALIIISLVFFICYVVGHTRTAFKEK